jgi:hypothetical protein
MEKTKIEFPYFYLCSNDSKNLHEVGIIRFPGEAY